MTMRSVSPLRLVLALIGLTLLTAAAPVRDWTAAVRQTPAGAFVIGNPAAPLKLVEYGSYTCSHCAAFAVESEPVLVGQMIRSGSVSLEYRHLIRDPADLAAAVLARCGGGRRFHAASLAIFRDQDAWLKRVVDWQTAHPEVASLSPQARLRGYADASGLTAMTIRRGVPKAAIDACFADQAAQARITKMVGDAPMEVTYTPFFFLNGTALPGTDWAKLEQTLRARGAK